MNFRFYIDDNSTDVKTQLARIIFKTLNPDIKPSLVTCKQTINVNIAVSSVNIFLQKTIAVHIIL